MNQPGWRSGYGCLSGPVAASLPEYLVVYKGKADLLLEMPEDRLRHVAELGPSVPSNVTACHNLFC